MASWEILFFFLLVAFIYSSVGFGGGSSYLAILSLYNFQFQEMRLIALICNIIVVTGGVYIYIKNKQVDWRKTLPITLISVPAAYLGAILKISQEVFFLILGITLIIASVLLWLKTENNNTETYAIESKFSILRNSFLGGGIGFLSGMVGIGGGIFLSPLLNLLKWDNAKKIAATSSVFILANSVSGIIGQLTKLPAELDYVKIGCLCFAVFIGGQIGSRFSLKWQPLIIRRMTAALVLLAGINVLMK